jgi:hypothetical protein
VRTAHRQRWSLPTCGGSCPRQACCPRDRRRCLGAEPRPGQPTRGALRGSRSRCKDRPMPAVALRHPRRTEGPDCSQARRREVRRHRAGAPGYMDIYSPPGHRRGGQGAGHARVRRGPERECLRRVGLHLARGDDQSRPGDPPSGEAASGTGPHPVGDRLAERRQPERSDRGLPRLPDDPVDPGHVSVPGPHRGGEAEGLRPQRGTRLRRRSRLGNRDDHCEIPCVCFWIRSRARPTARTRPPTTRPTRRRGGRRRDLRGRICASPPSSARSSGPRTRGPSSC